MNKQIKITIGLLVISCFAITVILGNGISYASNEDNGEQNAFIDFNDGKLADVEKLLITANYFKRLFLTDYEQALMIFSDDKVIEQFKVLNKEIWIQTPPELGWALFMSAAVHTAGGTEGMMPVVGFYYPFADVFLITQWNMKAEIPKITDVEVVAGDFIRTDTEDLKPLPYWLRTKTFRPFSLGDSVAETISAFENLFGSEPISNWRNKLPALKSKEVLIEVNYPVSSLMIYNNLMNIDAFRFADKETDPRLESCRNMTIQTVQSAASQGLDKLLEGAVGTLPETKKILKSLDKKWFRTFEIVTVLEAQDGCLVFLSPIFDPSVILTFLFEGDSAELSLSRMDIVDYSGFFDMSKKNREDEGSKIEGGEK